MDEEEVAREKFVFVFPPTDAFRAYWPFNKVHNVVNRIVSKKLAQWGLSVPKYGIIRQLYDNETLPAVEAQQADFPREQ